MSADQSKQYSVEASAKMCEALKAYLGMPVGDQDKSQALHFTCKHCTKQICKLTSKVENVIADPTQDKLKGTNYSNMLNIMVLLFFGKTGTRPNLGFPMVASSVCNEKIAMLYSYNEFIASNRIKQGVAYQRLGRFFGIITTPDLIQDMRFWTMHIELSIFEEGTFNQIFIDFGIIDSYSLEDCCSLTNNSAAYSCSIIQTKGGTFHLEFMNCSNQEGHSYQLPLELYQKGHFCYGFLYDFLNRRFAVVDCLSQEVLHIFNGVDFQTVPFFAVCPYHTEKKMRVEIKLDHEHATNEDVSSWMQKISKF